MNQIDYFFCISFVAVICAFYLQDNLSCSNIQLMEQKHLKNWLNWRKVDFLLFFFFEIIICSKVYNTFVLYVSAVVNYVEYSYFSIVLFSL